MSNNIGKRNTAKNYTEDIQNICSILGMEVNILHAYYKSSPTNIWASSMVNLLRVRTSLSTLRSDCMASAAKAILTSQNDKKNKYLYWQRAVA